MNRLFLPGPYLNLLYKQVSNKQYLVAHYGGAICRCLALVLAASLIACSTTPAPRKPKSQFPSSSRQEQPSKEMAETMPWELWAPFQDLKGGQLANRSLILGDELQQQGKRQSALDAYLKASTENLAQDEAEAAAIRIASQYLALDQSKKALSSVGAFFKRRGMSESEVDVPFALLLAFAYGRSGDIDQSLAWFSKVSTQGRPGGPAVSASTTGTKLLLKTVPPEDFERIASSWHNDTFISEHVGQERLRRSNPGYDGSAISNDRPFWLGFSGASLVGEGSPTTVIAPVGATSVGLILSLSDRFGALGRDTKQGFELAIEANNPKITVVARDVGADTASASAAVRELAANPGVSVVAGPLLTEAAVAAAQTAREVRVPIISFSKSESFATGGGVFRLGATTSSQIEAIVNSAFGEYGIRRFAVVYPESGSGTEFLEAFRRKLGEVGGALDLEVAYSSGDEASLMEVAQRLEGSAAEAVLIPDSIDVGERLLRQFSPSLRKRMRPLGTALWDNAAKISRSQALFERAIFVTPFFAQSSREEVQRFVDSYRAKFKVTPNFLAAQGFDVGTLIVNAVAKREAGAQTVERALSQLPPYNGVTGVITAQPSGEFSRSFYVVEVLRDTFQEKLPPANPLNSPVVARQGSAARPGSATPLLGAEEKVDSGY